MADLPTSDERYLGMWEENKYHGPGILVSENRLFYSGMFANGERSVSILIPRLCLASYQAFVSLVPRLFVGSYPGFAWPRTQAFCGLIPRLCLALYPGFLWAHTQALLGLVPRLFVGSYPGFAWPCTRLSGFP